MVYVVGYFTIGVVLLLYERSRPPHKQVEIVQTKGGAIVFIATWPLPIWCRLFR